MFFSLSLFLYQQIKRTVTSLSYCKVKKKSQSEVLFVPESVFMSWIQTGVGISKFCVSVSRAGRMMRFGDLVFTGNVRIS